jgi:tripartite-type tricarboxylate transporter receptor subunit TctC
MAEKAGIKTFWSRCRVVALASAFIVAPSVSYSTGAYPNQMIRLIVPFAAGGLPDTVARIIAPSLEEKLKQTIVIENRPGSGGGIAAQAVGSAPADGYQFIVTDNSFLSTNPFLYQNLSYQPREFVTVAQVAHAPLFLAVHPNVPARNMKEFIDYVRANPGKINYGSSGIGTMHHLSMEAIKAALKLDMAHVPFRGSGQSVPALLGGHVDALFSAYPSLSGAADGKQVIIIAGNAAGRSALLPDVPAVSEFIPGFDFASRIGIFARAGTSEQVLSTISKAIIQVTKEPSVIRKFEVAGIEAAGSRPDEFANVLRDETKRVEATVRAAGIQPQ